MFATVGLSQEAVHVTKLAPGEGLVGTIVANVETLNLAEAATHPDFADCRLGHLAGRREAEVISAYTQKTGF